jgi:hypothetical protein
VATDVPLESWINMLGGEMKSGPAFAESVRETRIPAASLRSLAIRRSLGLSLFLLLLSGSLNSQVTVHSFEGIDAATPGSGATLRVVDPNGAVGTKQYLEWIDTAYQAYDKATFKAVYTSPVAGDTPWLQNGMPNCVGTAGNGVALFDRLASRWIMAVRQGSTSTGNYYYCIAVSSTDDFTSATFKWFTYAQFLNNALGTNSHGHTYFPDYPKIASWPDAYYVTIDLEDPDNGYQEVGVLACAFDRANMLKGAATRNPQCFRAPATLGTLFLGHSLLPADVEGAVGPPAGTKEAFVSIQNPSSGNSSTKLNFWQFHVDWTTPTNSTFTGPTATTVTSYIPGCYNTSNPTNTVCVPEPSTSSTNNFIDSLGDRLMHRFAYRRFPTAPAQTYLVSQTIQAGSGSLTKTAIRWYEFSAPGTTITSGTINPSDTYFRFVPSIAQDKVGNLAVGYSVSGTTLSPSIRASYLNLRGGSTAPTEFKITNGTADEENAYHWGGYNSMTVDPVDDCTFWYVNEYFTTPQIGTGVTWRTRISNFKIPGCS